MTSNLIPLDEDTERWLIRMSLEAGVPPWVLVASMLRDIRVDDEKAHCQHETVH